LFATTIVVGQPQNLGLAETDRTESWQRAAELGPEVPPPSGDGRQQVRRNVANDDGTIALDVWAHADSPRAKRRKQDPAKLSRSFATTALSAATRLQFTERRIENSIKMGFPLGEFWIQTDFDAIDDSLGAAALSATTDADRQALQQLETQRQHLRQWSDWLIEQNRQLRLADYYISSSPLENDEQFQNSVSCTNFLLSMLSSGRVAEDNSCL
jgi:hypothetical protein